MIIVPKSTLANWMNELKKWVPCMRSYKFQSAAHFPFHFFSSLGSNPFH